MADERLGGEPFDDDVDAFDIKEAFDLPDRLPPLRLPDEDELAASAREGRLLDQAKRLASWVGDRPRTLRYGHLPAADAVAAAHAVGMDGGTETSPPGTAGLRELVRLWEIAEELDFIEADDSSATIGPAAADWPDGEDEDVLETWQHALAVSLTDGLPADPPAGLEFAGTGAAVLVMLFLARGDGLTRDDARTIIEEMATAALPPAEAEAAWQSCVDDHGPPADALLAELADLDAVRIEAETVRLTPLSLYATRLQMLDAGVDVPLLPPAEEMTAADLVQVATSADEEELAAESEPWLGRRSPEAAADELITVAAAGGPAERLAATSLASRVGVAGEARWRRALDEPALRPYAKITLAQLQGVEAGEVVAGLEPTPDDLAWLVTDMIAATADSLEPEELAQQLPAGEEQRVFEHIWRLDHPYAYDVLMTFGRQHPDKKVAKAARKAAYKLQPPAKRH